jgi:hypothetical protein
MAARLLLCLLVCALLAAPAAAQTTPLGPVPEEPAPVDDDPTDDDGGLSSTQLLLLGGAAFVLLAGIGWAIIRDARAAAPVDKDHAHFDSADRPRATKAPPQQRVKAGRAKAKAARQARKRNR